MSVNILEQGEGILWLLPCWVPRAAYLPGRRLKLHSDDLYAFGAQRGAINTRWLSSTTLADNGPYARPNPKKPEIWIRQTRFLKVPRSGRQNRECLREFRPTWLR